MRILKRRKGLVIFCVLLGIAGAIGMSMIATPMYRSSVRILVDAHGNNENRIDTDPVNMVSMPNAAPDIESQLGMLQSPKVLSDVFIAAGVPPPTADDIEGNMIVVKQVGSSNIINVDVSLPNKDNTLKIAERLPDSYNNYLINLQNGAVNTRIQSLTATVQKEQTALTDIDKKLADFNEKQARESNSVVGNKGAEDERQARLRTAEFQLNEAKARQAGAQERLDSVSRSRRDLQPTIYQKSTATNTDRKLDQKRIIASLKSKLADYESRYDSTHPDVIALKEQIRTEQEFLKNMDATDDRNQSITNPDIQIYDRMKTEAQADLSSAQATVASLQSVVDKEKGGLESFTKAQTERSKLERDRDLQYSKVVNYSRQLDELTLRSKSVKPPITTLSTTSAEQVSPRLMRSILIGLFLGVILGLVSAVIRDRTDDRVYTMDQIQESCGILALGRVPQAERPLALVPGTERGQSTALESYRSLRFSLDSSKDGFVESIALTSPTASEGRAELAYNVAVEAARDLRNTILVDADLRKPTIHGMAGIPESPGLSDYLMGKATLDQVLHTTANSHLSVIPAGTPHENPLQLLTSPEMAALHAELTRRADAIVFNSPSLLRYADGRAIAKIANSVILVAKKGVTKRNALRYCADMLRRTNSRLLGVVLNDSSSASSDVPYFYSSEEASA